jgi:tagaturonate reductase
MKALNRKIANIEAPRPVKIIQFGSGNFLRGFTDWMVDILNEKTDFNAAIQVVKNTKSIADIDLNTQDGLYHTILAGKIKGELVENQRLISCIKSEINPYTCYEAFLQLGLEKELQLIVSNTTEQGIFFDETASHSAVCPDSFAAKLTALLHYRFKNYPGIETDRMAILPTELIENNGDILQNIVFQYIQHWHLEPAFAQYIQKHIYFYNTLVDRIVPGFPIANAAQLQQNIGYHDRFIVKAEPYYIWVLQGDVIIKQVFPYQNAGLNIKLVDDIAPFRALKVRILNGLHTIMVTIALERGLKTVRDVMQDAYCRSFIETAVFEEIIPALQIDQQQAASYAKSVFERYENPYIEHLLQSIALNTLSKFKVRVLPSILDYYQKYDTLPKHLTISLAHLIAIYLGQKNLTFELKDDQSTLDFFKRKNQADLTKETIQAILSNQSLWGQDLSQIAELQDVLYNELTQFYAKQKQELDISVSTISINNTVVY